MYSLCDLDQVKLIHEYMGFGVMGKPGSAPTRLDLNFMPLPLYALCGAELSHRATCRGNGISPQNPYERVSILDQIGWD